jgi:hypothetical protein
MEENGESEEGSQISIEIYGQVDFLQKTIWTRV